MIPAQGGRQQRAWGVTQDQMRQDVVDALRAAQEAGEPLTARAQPAIYQAARRAFSPGGWGAAIDAAFGVESRIARRPAPDPTQLIRELDCLSPVPCRFLPDYMRERQILGGRMFEILAMRLAMSEYEFSAVPGWMLYEAFLSACEDADDA